MAGRVFWTVAGAALLLLYAGAVAGQAAGPDVTYGCVPGTATYPTAECSSLWEERT
jgi:hypothetical protein